jgi:hypothetical protein
MLMTFVIVIDEILFVLVILVCSQESLAILSQPITFILFILVCVYQY